MSRVEAKYDPVIGTYEFTFKAKFSEIQKLTPFIKQFIPASERSYEPSTYTWTVDEKHWPALEAAFKLHNFYAQVTKPTVTEKEYVENFYYDATPAAQVETKETVAAKLETLLSVSVVTAPFDELKRAYRKKALELHPDRNNGDGSRMSELNSLWTIYNKS